MLRYTSNTMEVSQARFDELIAENVKRKFKSKSEIDDIIARLREIKGDDSIKKKPADYRLLQKYKVVTYNELNSDEESFVLNSLDGKVIVAKEDLYGVISSAHNNTGHGGRDILEKDLGRKFHNVTRESINIFLSLCEPCKLKRIRVSKSVVVKPIISNQFNSRCQVDLIDMQADADGPFKFIMNYQDHLTKFVILLALKTKTAVEVAYNLLDVFSIVGAPLILQSDNGREFANQIVKEVAHFWPDCHIVHGKPRHSQSQGSVERANRDIEEKLACWRHENKGQRWSDGLRFVQLQKNICHHTGIKTSPYEALFGVPPKNGINGMVGFPKVVLDGLETEEDLHRLLQSTEIGEAAEPTACDSQPQSTCISCSLPTETTCVNCTAPIHYSVECAHSIPHTSTQTQTFQCNACQTKLTTATVRKEAKRNMEIQATAMTTRSTQRLSPVAVGDTVMVPVPSFDRSKCDLRNVKCIVLSVDEDFYKLGTEFGRLKSLYTRTQFTVTSEKFIRPDDVPNVEITLREVSTKSSNGTGQGFFRCHCTKKCQDKKCKCVKNNVQCNSKCHNSDPCCNK